MSEITTDGVVLYTTPLTTSTTLSTGQKGDDGEKGEKGDKGDKGDPGDGAITDPLLIEMLAVLSTLLPGQVVSKNDEGALVALDVSSGGGTPAFELPDDAFGSGFQGDITLSTLNQVITGDIEAENLTITAARVYIGWNSAEGRPARIRVRNTLTMANSAIISNSGWWDQAARVVGGNFTSARAGGAGGTDGGPGATGGTVDATGTPGTDQPLPSIGSRGQTGMGAGYDQSQVGGVGGTISIVTLSTLAHLLSGQYEGQQIGGGSGGGSSRNSGGANNGGAGGGGGGVIHILAKTIVTSGSGTPQIVSVGGYPGYTGAGGNGVQNGGFGGNGGIIIVTESFDPKITMRTSFDGSTGYVAGSYGPPAAPGHIYLASKHLDGEYIYAARGYYHPFVVF